MDAEVLEFGQALVETGDLDPVYIYLTAKKLKDPALRRWLLAYSMFYHVGVSDYLSQYEDDEFWKAVGKDFQTFPRGEERRHFRGQVAINAVTYMSEFVPETVVDYWYKDLKFKEVIAAIQTLPLYGPWISFKLADMGERCLGLNIDFSECELNFYKEPRMGAALVLTGNPNYPIQGKEVLSVVDYITTNLNDKDLRAPPGGDRRLNIQEAETILCKYKSFKKGHYYVGKDIEAVKKAITWYV
jgi:hypothetical protein